MTNKLPVRIYRAAQVRELDRLAIDELGIPGYTLMYRAGEAAFRTLRRRWPRSRQLLVLCGAGNNAGDGYVLARIARSKGMQVTVAALVDPEKLVGDARIAWETYHASGGTVTDWEPDMLLRADVIVDAILGTGLARPLEGKPRELVEAVNASPVEVLSLDIPTGLHADTGRVMGAGIVADMTITFVGLKLGLYSGDAINHVGKIVFDGLGIPAKLTQRMPCAGRRIAESHVIETLPPRARTAHKGQHGHVLVVAGNRGMGGAAILAASAALYSGAGRVTVATQPEHVSATISAQPELMCRGVSQGAELDPLLDMADVIAVGPGLGRDNWSQEMLDAVLSSDKPKVVDADALNFLADQPVKRDDWVLTPHPGEAARLLGTTTSEIQHDRFAAVARLLEKFGGTIVLKGAGSLVGHVGEAAWICDRGNPGMASPGMGDVLTGIIAAVAAQCGDLTAAARCGVFIHASAGDDAARRGERGVVAGDLFKHIAAWINLS
ncbi:MAG: NAD(P)H-hydrate dehydratase [Gammaproteobacteria bacterium]|nr:NAD(P)H-hydrate dehydratase [Gammaproteobacteria bacterium]NNF60291.1 NAD(P)H-hydrate dehydratase [Gammaproteobacteria bacterium]NNM20399.1 NAD(P)H-hydrate dehydratase [Gammaproteobacteria bacterium]